MALDSISAGCAGPPVYSQVVKELGLQAYLMSQSAFKAGALPA